MKARNEVLNLLEIKRKDKIMYMTNILNEKLDVLYSEILRINKIVISKLIAFCKGKTFIENLEIPEINSAVTVKFDITDDNIYSFQRNFSITGGELSHIQAKIRRLADTVEKEVNKIEKEYDLIRIDIILNGLTEKNTEKVRNFLKFGWAKNAVWQK